MYGIVKRQSFISFVLCKLQSEQQHIHMQLDLSVGCLTCYWLHSIFFLGGMVKKNLAGAHRYDRQCVVSLSGGLTQTYTTQCLCETQIVYTSGKSCSPWQAPASC